MSFIAEVLLKGAIEKFGQVHQDAAYPESIEISNVLKSLDG